MRRLLLVSSFTFLLVFVAISSAISRETTREAVLSGRVFAPIEYRGKVRELPLRNARVVVLDARTGEVVATSSTDMAGRYEVTVSVPGVYLLEIQKGNLCLLDFSGRIRKERTYDLGFVDTRSTALTLVLLELFKNTSDLAQIVYFTSPRVLKTSGFKELTHRAWDVLLGQGDPTKDPEVLEAARNLALLFPIS
ncbi:MAG: hypothetical protein ACUVTO_08390 [Candidatus Caldatribacteriaceae bacterium]